MLANGEHEAGVTLHHMVARADAGDIVGQRSIPIDDSDTALTLYRKLVPLGVALLTEMHPLIVQGRAPRHPQDLSRGSYSGAGVRGRTNRLAMACATHLQSGARRDASLSGGVLLAGGRKLWVWESGIATRRDGRAMRARSCRRPRRRG